MKVGVVATGPLAARGQGRWLAQRVTALRAEGHAVTVFAPPDADQRLVEGHAVNRVAVRDVLCERLASRERRWLAQEAFWVLYEAYDPLLEALRLVPDRPVVAEYAGVAAPGRGAPDVERQRRAQARAGVRVLALAHRVLIPGEALRPELEESGVDPSMIHVSKSIEATAGAAGAPRPAGAALVTVGRPCPPRRLEVLVESLARIVRIRRDAHLTVVGPLTDPEARAARDDALGWARALGVLERVTFTGELDEAALVTRLDAGIAVFAGAGRRSLAVAEALARGRPVVCDRASPLARLHPAAAHWVDGADAAAIAGAVLQLLGGTVGERPGAKTEQLLGGAVGEWPGAKTEQLLGGTVGERPGAKTAPLSSHLVISPHRPRPSLVPLMELIARPIAYPDDTRWPLLSWLRTKATRHLAKFFARALDAHQRAFVAEATRELRNLRTDADYLSARLRPGD